MKPILRLLMLSELRRERWQPAVKHLDALSLRNPGKVSPQPADQLLLGRALLAVGDHGRARHWFQSVMSTAFVAEREVGEVYARRARPRFRAGEHVAPRTRRGPILISRITQISPVF